MPKYNYTALNMTNKKVNGILDAVDDDDLRKQLRQKGLSVTKYRQKDESAGFYRLKTKEVAEFSRQLASMLSSGITVIRALEILKERDFNPKLLRIFDRLYKDVQQGNTLSEAMQKQGKAFPELFVNMYASGEASGQLERVASKMAFHFDREHRLNAKAKSAMTYPIVLLVTTLAVIMVIFVVIMPSFAELFAQIDMPALTRLMFALSAFLESYWYLLLIGVLILIFTWQTLLINKNVRYGYDRMKLFLPIVGKLLRTIYTARFARTLSSLYSSGIPVIRALEITATVINNSYIEAQFTPFILNVRNGSSLAEAIEQVVGFDRKLSATVMIGEESGRLDSMLDATAESFDYEAEIALEKLVTLIQPIMIALLALVILPVILSVMMAMLTIYNNPQAFG